MADKTDRGSFHPDGATISPNRDIDRARRDFARAMAKAELGRFYWSESAERVLQEVRRKKPPKRSAPK